MLLNSACSVSGLLDWHRPPQGRFVQSIASVSSPRSTTRLTRTSSTSQTDHPWWWPDCLDRCLGQSGTQHGQGRRGPGLQVGFTTTATRLRASAFGALQPTMAGS